MSPNYTTIISPLEPSQVEACRRYLREKADPRSAGDVLQCQPLFRFDKVTCLHFCSFVILDADGDLSPSLVFEATFDGPWDNFIGELLSVASEGFDEVYRHCSGYVSVGFSVIQLIKDYLSIHDVGANTFFCGSPGRSVAQIRGENLVRNHIVSFLAKRSSSHPVPARSAGFLEAVRRDVVRSQENNRWAEQSASPPWEVSQRSLIVLLSLVTAFALVCGVGLTGALLFDLRPLILYDYIVGAFERVSQIGAGIGSCITSWLPWIARYILIEPATLHILIALSVAWLVVRIFELFLTSWTRNPHDQLFINRFPLQLAVIVRYTLIIYLVGSVVLAIISRMDAARSAAIVAASPPGLWTSVAAVAAVLGCLLLTGVILVVLNYWATCLKLAVELRPYDAVRENVRRLLLDIDRFLMVIALAIGALLIARYIPFSVNEQIAMVARLGVFVIFVLMAYGFIGIFSFYGIGLVIFAIIRVMELRDKRRFADPAELIARARENATKYTREEGGIHRYQNHLASITSVKPGFIRRWLLRLALFVINLLSRFWFNRGELGGIPTILSARWVMIDGGRRLLFLDNFGGAWESYLNEFIDLAAVKGLNAIWSNTFVSVGGKRYSFPETKFLFWKGAQAEQPFKAYVRQSQIETLVWYSAYPTLSVVNINANTSLRQSLFKPSDYREMDSIFQNL